MSRELRRKGADVVIALTHLAMCEDKRLAREAEVDFVFENPHDSSEIIPLEVKGGLQSRSHSLAEYRKKYFPKTAIRTSLRPFGKRDGVLELPLYAVASLHTNQVI